MDSSLYQQIILEHHKNPRHYGSKTIFDARAEEINQLCGDTIQVFVKYNDSDLLDLSFEANACSIVRASASIMVSQLHGTSIEGFFIVKTLFENFLAGKPDIISDSLGELIVFEGVRQYPTRKKCALLPWKALEKALTELQSGTT